MSGKNPVRAVSNLHEAYQAIEKGAPKAAIFSEDLARLPDFEVILALLRLSNVRAVVLDAPHPEMRAPTIAFASGQVDRVQETMTDASLCGILGLLPQRAESQQERSGQLNRGAKALLLGASTGGVEALIKILSTFPQDCPPLLIVQHTGGSFSAGLARLLDSRAPIRVCEAEDGIAVRPGMAVLAPGDRFHLKMAVRGNSVRCSLVDEPPLSGHRPSIDVLFQSAVPAAKSIAAAILTGMGRDGANGLLALKNAGARTFGQDEETSLVYGMPKVAAEMGAVEQQLPLDRIGPALLAARSERTAA
ncbi:MAG: CheB methylesterase domain-containing protein [Pseudomonadota bacterium]